MSGANRKAKIAIPNKKKEVRKKNQGHRREAAGETQLSTAGQTRGWETLQNKITSSTNRNNHKGRRGKNLKKKRGGITKNDEIPGGGGRWVRGGDINLFRSWLETKCPLQGFLFGKLETKKVKRRQLDCTPGYKGWI